MTPVRHRALVFDARLSAGNTANDTLVTGGTFRFCRLMCLCVKQRNIKPVNKPCSLLDSALFRADNRTEQKTISPFSLALIFTFDFAALSECRSCPEDRSRRFVLLGALDAALRQRTYPVRTVMQFSRFRFDCKTILAKNPSLPAAAESSLISLLLLFPQKPSLLWEPCDAVMAVTSLGTYPVRTVMQFSRFRCDCKTILAKNIALSRISKRSENALKNTDFHAHGQDRKRAEI